MFRNWFKKKSDMGVLVWSRQATWLDSLGKLSSRSNYYIRKMRGGWYELSFDGTNPIMHSLYDVACSKLIELNTGIKSHYADDYGKSTQDTSPPFVDNNQKTIKVSGDPWMIEAGRLLLEGELKKAMVIIENNI